MNVLAGLCVAGFILAKSAELGDDSQSPTPRLTPTINAPAARRADQCRDATPVRPMALRDPSTGKVYYEYTANHEYAIFQETLCDAISLPFDEPDPPESAVRRILRVR